MGWGQRPTATYNRPAMERFKWIQRLPCLAILTAVLLMLAGWLGIARAESLAGSSGHFLRAQIVWSVLSLLAAGLVVVPSYRVFGRHSYLLFVLVLVALTLVYWFPPINGARRWIRIAGVGLQPSELAKVVFVLALARYLMYRENFRRLTGLLIPLAVSMAPIVLILREPDLGTAIVFLPVLLTMLAIAGARRRDLALVAGAGICLLPLLWTQMSAEQRSRVTALFSQTPPGTTVRGDGYHLAQAKQMLVLGGFSGSYFQGEITADRSVYQVPEGSTDSVFVILVERYGLRGGGLLLLLYFLLVWRILVVAERTREPFGRLVASGIATLLAVQVVINTGMMVGLLPITGLSLPLVSYGGSGLVANGIALGLVVNIALRPGYEVAAEPFRYQVEKAV